MDILAPVVIPDKDGNHLSKTIDDSGNTRKVRLLSWIDGRLWSSVNPVNEGLLFSLGKEAGRLTRVLESFDHKKAYRIFAWDIAQAEWTRGYLDLFTEQQNETILYFIDQFSGFQEEYQALRKSVVHSDANDNNIIVSENLVKPKVKAIIDFGDAIHTQTINDLAIAIAYAIMNKPDPLRASLPIIRGYHSQFNIQEREIKFLYTLIAMRLVISVTKSAINRRKEPENEYLIISEAPAWKLLESWKEINEDLAHYCFRYACGYPTHPDEKAFLEWASNNVVGLDSLFPTLDFKRVQPVDMSVSSTWIGGESDYSNLKKSSHHIQSFQDEHKDAIIAGGYCETRPFYSTDAFRKEGNNGSEYRTVHLGIDFWVEVGTEIRSILDGTVVGTYNNAIDKDYGPTLILEHKTEEGLTFYTLYGHLSLASLKLLKDGDSVKKGELIGYTGHSNENGGWVPHLHFQVMLGMLGYKTNYPGVCFPDERPIWQSICPDPNRLFCEKGLEINVDEDQENIIHYRKKHLGKSLSLSYTRPLKIVRGSGAYLIDETGRKYLDTVNNVAHVGHEHPRVVKAGQEQMAVLNTNTRYLHNMINDFAKELLTTFPEELSVVHFVNSGSEANELALRMAYTVSGQKDIIAVEVGYHGNTTGCVDISSYKFDGKGGKGAPEHTHIVPLPDQFRGRHRGNDTGMQYAKYVDAQVKNIKSRGRNVAAFICESIMSCGGQIELPSDYLKIVYKEVRKAGGVCIADEVQVGCGRVGSHFWGFELYGVVPDIVTIGKPMGNGHPLAAVVCTKEVAEAFANGMEYFNTFGGNPVSCVIGKEVLQVISDEKLQKNALLTGNYLKSELSRLQSDYPIIGDVRGQGLFLGFELVDSKMNPLTRHASYLANRMKELGILMSTDGKDNNVLKIKPPMVFNKGNADELISRLGSVLNEDFMKDYA